MDNIKKIIYINLDRRVDRRLQIEAELSKMGLIGERFAAIDHINGGIGCAQSHISILKMAISEDLDNILIFEDDFQFCVNKETFYRNIHSFFNSKKTYDILMLSYNLKQSEPYNDIVGYARNVQTASGYIIHKRFYKTLLANFEECLLKLHASNEYKLYAIDQYWKQLQKDAEWFYFITRIGFQRRSYSDIELRNVKCSGI
jgi:GR25 family glycosyltransferase involved in LPS biosynthesis